MKNMLKLFIVSIFVINFVYSSCGSCPGDVAQSEQSVTKQAISNALVMSVPDDGKINGLVITTCGKCNLGTKEKGCSLSAKLGDSVYPVKGVSIHDHGNAHSDEGFCSAIRVAWANGIIKQDVFHVDSFVLVEK